MKRFALLFLFAFGFSLFYFNHALALESGGVGVLPANPRPNEPLSRGWFIYKEAAPGSLLEDEARILNTSDKTTTIKVEALDAIVLEDGGFTLVDNEKENQDIGSWITLERGEITLKARSETKVKFTLRVPLDAEVGDHAGGIVVSKVQASPDLTQRVGGGATIGITTRVGARIYLTVPGEIKRAFALLGKGYSYRGGQPLYLRFKLRNNGNVRAELQAATSIYGLFGLYDRQTVSIGQLMPKKVMSRQIAWPNEKKSAPFFGPYLALLTISDIHEVENVPPPPPVKSFLFMFFIPWRAVFFILILLFVAWLIYQFILWRRLARLAKAKVASYKAKRGETLPEIAAHFGLGWKFVAALNELKPPYALKEGQTLYLPDARGERRKIPAPKFLVQISQPFARLGSWVLGGVFRIDRFKRTTSSSRHAEPSPERSRRIVSGSKPPARSPAAGGTETLRSFSEGGQPRASRYLTAIVEAGDTLRSVAKHFQVDSKELIKLNHLQFPFQLSPGDELKIPRQAGKRRK